MQKLTIKEVPYLDRPYEKFEKHGAGILTDSELLAIIIKSGTRQINSVEVAKILLSKKENGLEGFNYLEKTSIQELMTYKGIGKVKAIQIKAALEIAKRYNQKPNKKIKITSPIDVYNLLKLDLQDLEVETIKTIILDTKSNVKSIVTISLGALNSSCLTLKEFLQEPIKQMASSIILVHNHPSGDTVPSKADIQITSKIVENVRVFDIDLKDHIIIGKTGYTSIREVNPEIFLKGRII